MKLPDGAKTQGCSGFAQGRSGLQLLHRLQPRLVNGARDRGILWRGVSHNIQPQQRQQSNAQDDLFERIAGTAEAVKHSHCQR